MFGCKGERPETDLLYSMNGLRMHNADVDENR